MGIFLFPLKFCQFMVLLSFIFSSVSIIYFGAKKCIDTSIYYIKVEITNYYIWDRERNISIFAAKFPVLPIGIPF